MNKRGSEKKATHTEGREEYERQVIRRRKRRKRESGNL